VPATTTLLATHPARCNPTGLKLDLGSCVTGGVPLSSDPNLFTLNSNSRALPALQTLNPKL